MKKLYTLLIVLLCSAAHAFGQKAYSSDNPQYTWGEWRRHECYNGIYVRTQKAYFNTLSKKWYWNVQIQNKYNKRVSLSWCIYEPGAEALFNSRHTYETGAIYSTGGFGGEKQVGVRIGDLCFEFKMVNGMLMDNCAGLPDNDQFHYADCDNGTPSYRAGGNGQGTAAAKATGTQGAALAASSDAKTNAQPDLSNPGTVMAMIHKKNDLCETLRTLVQKTGINSPAYDKYCVTAAAQQYTMNDGARLKAEIAEMERGITVLNTQGDVKKKEDDEKLRVAQAKQKEFDNLISQGDMALNNKNYDGAMGYYTRAKNAAQDDGSRNLATQKYNQAFEAKRGAERETRVAAVRQRDREEDATYLAGAGAAAGAMAFLNDGYVHRGLDFKLSAALGYAQMPLITNQDNQYAPKASYADKASFPTIDFGMRFEILNNKPVNFFVRGNFSVGLSAFEKGVNGTYTDAGVDGGIQFWYKTKTKFKLFADYGWFERTGERKRDEDAVSGTSATDIVRVGEYKYAVWRMGFGPMLHFRADGKETWIKPGVYFDKFSFAQQGKPKMLYMVNMNLNSSILMELSYASDYPAAGTINYPNAFKPAKQDYFTFKIIKQGRFW